MILNKNEISRIYETMKLLKEKTNIKDIDYNNALNKLETLVNCNTNIVCNRRRVSRKGYKNLSDEARNFINRRIEEGHRNTYHSLMSVLSFNVYIYRKKEEFKENKNNMYNNYIIKRPNRLGKRARELQKLSTEEFVGTRRYGFSVSQSPSFLQY